jgi:hypothetical protein
MDLLLSENTLIKQLEGDTEKSILYNVYNGFTNICYARSEQYKDRGAF